MTGKEAVDYLNASVFCTLRPSPVQGIGAFAIRDIPEGIRLTDNEFYDRNDDEYFLTGYEIRQLDYRVRVLVLDRMLFADEKVIRFGSPNGDCIIRSFMNHSDDSNSDGVFSTRYIKQGEEITENYHALQPKLHPLSKKHLAFLKC